MRRIGPERIRDVVAQLCIEANYQLPKEVIQALRKARRRENSSLGREVLDQLIENARIAEEGVYPLCQDTGMVEVFLEIGERIRIEDLEEAVQEGVRKGYRKGYLRKSIVSPLNRKNTKNNTPAIIHTKIVKGERLKIIVFIKGFGSENVSATGMLLPSQGREGVVEFVLEKVREAGADPCPPIVVGVGIGGTLEKSSLLAKEALLRPLGRHHAKKEIRSLEKELLKKINGLGIGPSGLGGKITSLAVHIETFPTHIAGLPVAVNINCHALRYARKII
ncbi:L(+)-tartrate dehydratase subunit alpha [subsurface metagenome]